MNLLVVDDAGRFLNEYLQYELNGMYAITVLETTSSSHVNSQIQMALNGFPAGRTIIAWTSTELTAEVVEEILKQDEPCGMVVSKGEVDDDRPLRKYSFRRNTILPEYGPEHNRGILNVYWTDEGCSILDEDTRDFCEVFVSGQKEKEEEVTMVRTRDFKIHTTDHGEFTIG